MAVQKKPQSSEIFVTNITSDGTKLFNFSVTMEKPNNQRQRNKGGGSRGGKNGGGSGRMSGSRGNGSHAGKSNKNREKMIGKLEVRVLERLQIKLVKVGYCRENFSIVDSYYSLGESVIRGKCNEKATTEDHERVLECFIDTFDLIVHLRCT